MQNVSRFHSTFHLLPLTYLRTLSRFLPYESQCLSSEPPLGVVILIPTLQRRKLRLRDVNFIRPSPQRAQGPEQKGRQTTEPHSVRAAFHGVWATASYKSEKEGIWSVEVRFVVFCLGVCFSFLDTVVITVPAPFGIGSSCVRLCRLG